MKHIVGNNIAEDFLIGCNFGDITGLIDEKIILLKENAHLDSINSIVISKLSRDVINLFFIFLFYRVNYLCLQLVRTNV